MHAHVCVCTQLMALTPEVSSGFYSPGSACRIPEIDIAEQKVGATTMSKVILQLLCFASIIESDFITGGYECRRGHGMPSHSCKYLLRRPESGFCKRSWSSLIFPLISDRCFWPVNLLLGCIYSRSGERKTLTSTASWRAQLAGQ